MEQKENNGGGDVQTYTVPMQSRHKHQAFLFIFALLAGFVGGLFSPAVIKLYEKYNTSLSQGGETKLPSSPSTTTDQPLLDDNRIVNLVEKHSQGVVSIVISKEISQMRRYNSMDFFGGFPFFSPFDVPKQDSDTTTKEKQKIGSGSGFFVSNDGMIVTNKHVVSDEQAEYTVIMQGGKEYSAKVLARDPNNDIAVLKIEGSDFPALTLGDSSALKVGQTVVAIGNALGEFSDSVTSGIISGLKRNVSAGSGFGMEEKLTDIIQTDTAINPGNSGGPLFNISGEVIGINVAVARGAENVGFALPIDSVKRVIDRVKKTGKISVPYIGVRYVLLDDEIQKANNLPYNYGALVLRGTKMTDFAVIPGSPADKANIVENDIILRVNGKKIDADHPLTLLISEYVIGDEVTFSLWHKGKESDVKLTLEERK
ncbi:MAG TPA: hypothetical protein DHV33_01650 [Candidatus Moranbacteria bacterium]|nr:hypothetical protein [Candidatus Moranbacteria bacterium]